jgi:hypothetical protein
VTAEQTLTAPASGQDWAARLDAIDSINVTEAEDVRLRGGDEW